MSAEHAPGNHACRVERVAAEELSQLCVEVAANGGALVALWGDSARDEREPGFVLNVALRDREGLRIAELALDGRQPAYPDLSGIFHAAGRMQRATFDLYGLRAKGAPDPRPWLRHGAWGESDFPLRPGTAAAPSDWPDPYEFVRVTGDGVHEIPVGPVHAGIIEPGHFRFSVVGEKVLRLEQRLGYVHKGIEKRFEGMTLEEGVRLAARISGDTAVGYAWAYCAAAEQIADMVVPPRALSLRALCLERERLANHLGDLGALGNDAGFAFGQSQFTRLKEELLRENAACFGQRYLNDALVLGGVASDFDEARVPASLDRLVALAREVETLREIYENHAGVQDRFVGAGLLAPERAHRLGVSGLAGRASGQPFDLRCDLPFAPYDKLEVRRASRDEGDVAARVAVRFDEVLESIHLCRVLLTTLPEGPHRQAIEAAPASGTGYGWIEAWRGPVFVALSVGADGRIARCHAHDPSWENWPALEHAVLDNIVPDFPLINKSFNLSYSGHDL